MLNNPGKLAKGVVFYAGEVLEDDNSNFRSFYDIVWGYRAMLLEMKRLISLRYNTLRDIAVRWRPVTKAEANEFIDFIRENANIREMDIINPEDKIIMIKLICEISHYLNNEMPDLTAVIKAFDLLEVEFE